MRGRELPETLKSYLNFCGIRSRFHQTKRLVLDLEFVFPTTLLPLAVLRAQTGAELRATNPTVQGYAHLVTTADAAPPGGTYVPVVRLPSRPSKYLEVLERLNDLSTSTKLFAANRQAYRYLLSELGDNIYEHAGASCAFVMAQAYPTKRLIEASFMDDGRTIPGSLGEGTGIKYPPEEAYKAILAALEGKSAKGTGERGYGLRTSARIVNELGGEVLIVSGRGAVVIGASRQRLAFELRPEHELRGTLVGLRLSEGTKTVNLYDLVEG